MNVDLSEEEIKLLRLLVVERGTPVAAVPDSPIFAIVIAPIARVLLLEKFREALNEINEIREAEQSAMNDEIVN